MDTHNPVPAVLGVVVRRGRVLLVQRANPPDEGRWGFPGGHIEWGEGIEQAAIRELQEETGVIAVPGEVLTAIDVIDPATSDARHHFVLIAVSCRWTHGEGEAADDALKVGWYSPKEIADIGAAASLDVERLARMAVAREG